MIMKYKKNYKGSGILQFKKVHFLSFFVVVLVLAVILLPGIMAFKSRIENVRTSYRPVCDPIIFVPGSHATINRFNEFLSQLNKSSENTHSILRIEILTKHHFLFHGAIHKGDYQPFIVIGFKNNRDGFANMSRQAKLLSDALKMLEENYRFKHFSAVGHSNGGIIWTLMFEQNDLMKTHVRVTKLVTIGSPFNLEENNPKIKTKLYRDMYSNRYSLPETLCVYSIVGAETLNSDGVVPITSMTNGRYIFQKQVSGFTQILITGQNTEHSDLLKNVQVELLVHQFLLN